MCGADGLGMTQTVDTMKMLADRARQVWLNKQNDAISVPSPCISVCKMDADRMYCLGCLRTLDELRAWGRLDNDGKRAIWQYIEARMP
jgi:uncharacterized protein